MKYYPKSFEVIVALLFIFLCLFLGFTREIKNITSLLFAPGDGAKNYFTYLFHIVYDPTYWKFTGMHYPFGENIVFTDNQPLLANIVKWFHQSLNFGTASLIAIHNITLFLGTGIGGLGIFLVLRKLSCGFWFSLIAAIGLLFIQPQLQRFQSHYSMVYPVLPWIFYFLLLIWEGKNPWRYALIVGFLNVVLGATHMYHFLTISVVSILGLGLYFMENLTYTRLKVISLWLLSMVFIPLAILLTLTNIVEPVPDRPQKVWGFFSYNSSWEGLLFHYRLPLYKFVNEHITNIRPLDQVEAFNYIGIISVMFVLAFIFKSFWHWKISIHKLKHSLDLQGKLGWIFVVSALLSFGLPFTITGLGWLLDYAGPYQQFRGIARLGWISFYAINFISLPYLYQWVQTKRPWIKSLLFGLISFFLLWEGMLLKPNLENPPHLEKAYKEPFHKIPVQIEAYQCLLPDPYLHAGSEAFNWGPVGLNQDQTLEIGYHLGLPSMATILSRTSLEQSTLLNQLICQPYEVPQIISLLKEIDTRPILVLESKLELYNYNSSISHWTKGTEVVYENQEFRLRRLPLDHFEHVVNQYLDSLAKNPVDTLYNLPLNFEHSKKEKSWGYEAIQYCDSLTRGEAVIALDIAISENKDVNAIIEVWQITKEHQNADRFSVRANYHYKKLKPGHMYVEVPIHIKPETDKIAIRLFKDNQREKDSIKFWHPRLFGVRKDMN